MVKVELSALHRAVRDGETEDVRHLLLLGAEVEAEDSHGSTPLHLAVTKGHTESVRLLIAAGASVNRTNQYGETALYRAISYQRVDCVKFLLDCGAKANLAGAITALHAAVKSGSLDCLKLILNAGVDVEAKHEGETALLYAARHRGDNVELIKLLLDAGSDANTTDPSGVTPLYYAVFGEKTQLAQLLVKAGANVNYKHVYRGPLLHVAVSLGKLDFVKLLLCSGADIKSPEVKTALHLAARRCQPDFINLLIEAGISVRERNGVGDTPLHCVAGATGAASVACARALLRAGAPPDARGAKGNTPIVKSIVSGNTDMLALLILSNCDVDLPDVSVEGRPLYIAVRQQRLDMADMLLAAGARTDVLDYVLSHFESFVSSNLHQDTVYIKRWICSRRGVVPSLFRTCRTVIRRALRSSPADVDSSVKCLPIPTLIKNDLIEVLPDYSL